MMQVLSLKTHASVKELRTCKELRKYPLCWLSVHLELFGVKVFTLWLVVYLPTFSKGLRFIQGIPHFCISKRISKISVYIPKVLGSNGITSQKCFAKIMWLCWPVTRGLTTTGIQKSYFFFRYQWTQMKSSRYQRCWDLYLRHNSCWIHTGMLLRSSTKLIIPP